MKFSSFCFFGVLGLASAQPNLRASSATIDNEAISLINTSVIYEGIKTEHATIDDMAIIQMSVAAALDEIYGDVSDNEVEDGMLGICSFICRLVRDRNPPKVGPPPPKPAPIICGAWVSFLNGSALSCCVWFHDRPSIVAKPSNRSAYVIVLCTGMRPEL